MEALATMTGKIKTNPQKVKKTDRDEGENPLLIKPGSIHQYGVERAMETGSRILVFSYNAS